MKVSPLAGKPADPASLDNVPRLVTAYCAEIPDPSVRGLQVWFGTSGHRGSAFDKAFHEWYILAIRIRLIGGPFGGAGVRSCGPTADRFGLDLTVVNQAVHATFRSVTTDGGGHIRMAPCSSCATQRLAEPRDRFEIAFACGADHAPHGIVTRSEGRPSPDHHLSVAYSYLSSASRNGPRFRAFAGAAHAGDDRTGGNLRSGHRVEQEVFPLSGRERGCIGQVEFENA